MVDSLTKSQNPGDANFALSRYAAHQNDIVTKRIQNSQTVGNMKEIEDAAKDFEAVFMSEMLKPMFAEVKTDPMFGGGKGEDVFQGMMISEYGKIMAERGGIGIADHVKEEMIRIQEALNAQTESAQNE